MASPAQVLTRPKAVGVSGRTVVSLALVGLAIAILILAERVQPRMALYWVLGLGLGLVLQRGRLCFAGAFRDLFLMRNGTMMRAIIVGLAIMAPVFALIESRAVPEPRFGAVGAGHAVAPVGLNRAVGGVLFGIGMVVAGGCVSGTLYRIGEGYLASWASLIGILLRLGLALGGAPLERRVRVRHPVRTDGLAANLARLRWRGRGYVDGIGGCVCYLV